MTWRFLIERNPEPQAPSAPKVVSGKVDESAAWELLKDARKNLKQAQNSHNSEKVVHIDNWVGGGVAVLAALTGKKPEEVLAKLVEETGGNVAMALGEKPPMRSDRVSFHEVERTRPAPPPGAPKPLDLDSLTEEEILELGVIVPKFDEMEEEEEPLTGDVD